MFRTSLYQFSFNLIALLLLCCSPLHFFLMIKYLFHGSAVHNTLHLNGEVQGSFIEAADSQQAELILPFTILQREEKGKK